MVTLAQEAGNESWASTGPVIMLRLFVDQSKISRCGFSGNVVANNAIHEEELGASSIALVLGKMQ